MRLAAEGISVYSPHTAVDAAPGGLNDFLADIVTSSGTLEQERKIINPVSGLNSLPKEFSSAGYGRIVTFKEAQKLGYVVGRVIEDLGGLKGVSVAVPQDVSEGKKGEVKIKTVGICAGSGGSMLNGLDVDLLFTGELSHHEALAAIENGKCVITAFHSNTERAFLMEKLQRQLTETVEEELKNGGSEVSGLVDEFEVAVSGVDRDPFEIVTSLHEW